jgi:hypothetical protein
MVIVRRKKGKRAKAAVPCVIAHRKFLLSAIWGECHGEGNRAQREMTYRIILFFYNLYRANPRKCIIVENHCKLPT